MTKYEKELSKLKPEDPVQNTITIAGYDLIKTAGHGYLAVPTENFFWEDAREMASRFSYVGKEAVYLEEDEDTTRFINFLHKMKEK